MRFTKPGLTVSSLCGGSTGEFCFGVGINGGPGRAGRLFFPFYFMCAYTSDVFIFLCTCVITSEMQSIGGLE